MLKRFFETKLASLWHSIHKRLPARQWKGILSALTISIVSIAVIWGVWCNALVERPLKSDKAIALYNQAVDALHSQNNLYYQVDGAISFSLGTTVIEEEFTQLITIESQGSEQTKICVNETHQIGDFDIVKSSFYADGKELLSVRGAYFQAEIPFADYSKKFTPLVLFDPALYSTISGTAGKNNTTITFADPVGAETWMDTGITLITSDGIAELDNDHALVSSAYTTTYQLDDIIITAHYTSKLLSAECPPIQLPDESAYTPLTDIDSPYLLERACAYLTCINNIRTEYSDTITCQAFGDVRTQSFQLDISEKDDWSAQVATTVSVSNSSKAGVTTSVKTERFTNDTYASSTNGSDFSENPDVDKTTMIAYCKDLLIRTMILPQDISTVEKTESDSCYTFHFQGNDEFAHILAEEACTTLYQSATILTNLAQSSITDEISGYLTIDKNIGFPVSSGFHYQGTYTISDLPYQLTFKADQNYAVTQ